jgi:hypothetical protein
MSKSVGGTGRDSRKNVGSRKTATKLKNKARATFKPKTSSSGAKKVPPKTKKQKGFG